MSQVGICGIPSLWSSSQALLAQRHFKRDQITLLEKYHKMFAILRCHRKWENEKMFGKNVQALVIAGQAPSEYQYFTNNKLVSKFTHNKDGSNFNSAQKGLIAQSSTAVSQLAFAQSSQLKQIEQTDGQLPLQRQYVRSFFPMNTQGTSQSNYVDSDSASFKIINSETKIIKQVLECNNVQQVSEESATWSLLWSCNGLNHKQQIYDQMTDGQRVNHFINSTELTRKDRIFYNFMRMRKKFGAEEFDYLPETYVLPDQLNEFKSVFSQNSAQIKRKGSRAPKTGCENENLDSPEDPSNDNIWIVKPAQSSRGRGIFLLTDLSELPPSSEQHVISKYISNPLLLNSYKFDIRLYVLVTSIDPLKVYIYNEGLVRFASEPYQVGLKGSKYSHLTNYSINKKNENFVQNKNSDQQDVGNKWSMSALQAHLVKLGINVTLMWSKIYDAIIKSLISVESSLLTSSQRKTTTQGSGNRNTCFELFGYDILLDQELNPWILEVNLAPSLTADSPLDYHIKSNLVVDMFNLAGVRRPPKKRGGINRQVKQKSNSVVNYNQQQTMQQSSTVYGGNGFGHQNEQLNQHSGSQTNLLKGNQNGRNLKKGHGTISQGFGCSANKQQTTEYGATQTAFKKTLMNQGTICYEGVEINILEKISKISAKHRSMLIETLSEFERNTRLNFTRIFPSPGCSYYDQFFNTIRPNNKLVYKYLCQRTELWAIIEQSCFNDLQKTVQRQSDKELQADTKFNQDLLDEIYGKEEKSYLKSDEDVSELDRRKSHHELSPQQTRSHSELKDFGNTKPQNTDAKPSPRNHTSINFNKNEQLFERKNSKVEPSQAEQTKLINPKLESTQPDSGSNIHKSKQLNQSMGMASSPSKQPDPESKKCLENNMVIEEVKQQPAAQREQQVSFGPRKSQTQLLDNEGAVIASRNSLQRAHTNDTRQQTEVKNKSPLKEGMLTNETSPDQKSVQNTSLLNKITSSPKKEKSPDKLRALQRPQANIELPFNEPQQEPKDEDGMVYSPAQIIKRKSEKGSRAGSKMSRQGASTKEKTYTSQKQSFSMGHHPKDEVKRLNSSDLRQSGLGLKNARKSHTDLPLTLEHPASTTNKTENAKGALFKDKKKKEKVVITGDDILIEYVRRLKNVVGKTNTNALPNSIMYYLEKFLYHKVWQLSEHNRSPAQNHEFKYADIATKLKIRYREMKQRRETVKQADQSTNEVIDGKAQDPKRLSTLRNEIVSALTSNQVEQMVIQSNQQNPIEIVSFLVGKTPDSIGLLTRIERFNKKAANLTQNGQKNKEKGELMKKTIASAEEIQSSHPSEFGRPSGRHTLGPNGSQMSKTSVHFSPNRSKEHSTKFQSTNIYGIDPNALQNPVVNQNSRMTSSLANGSGKGLKTGQMIKGLQQDNKSATRSTGQPNSSKFTDIGIPQNIYHRSTASHIHNFSNSQQPYLQDQLQSTMQDSETRKRPTDYVGVVSETSVTSSRSRPSQILVPGDHKRFPSSKVSQMFENSVSQPYHMQSNGISAVNSPAYEADQFSICSSNYNQQRNSQQRQRDNESMIGQIKRTSIPKRTQSNKKDSPGQYSGLMTLQGSSILAPTSLYNQNNQTIGKNTVTNVPIDSNLHLKAQPESNISYKSPIKRGSDFIDHNQLKPTHKHISQAHHAANTVSQFQINQQQSKLNIQQQTGVQSTLNDLIQQQPLSAVGTNINVVSPLVLPKINNQQTGVTGVQQNNPGLQSNKASAMSHITRGRERSITQKPASSNRGQPQNAENFIQNHLQPNYGGINGEL